MLRLLHGRTLLVVIGILGWDMASGAELVGLPALQDGPVGDGLIFARISPVDAELELTRSEANGTETFEDDRLRGRIVRQSAAGAASFGINDNFRFTGFGTAENWSYRADSRLAPRREEQADGGSTEFGAGPLVGFGPLRLGAMASLVMLDRATSTTDDSQGDSSESLGSGSLPRLRLMAGWVSKALTIAGRARLYNDVAANSSGDGVETDVKRRLPGELGLDCRWQAISELEFGAAFEVLGLAQARGSQSTDEISLAAGGAYRPEPWFAVAGAYRYTTPTFADERDASLAVDNLGGSRIDLGLNYHAQQSRIQVGLGYVIPQAASYDTAYGEEVGWKFQGGETRIERSIWDVTVSGLAHL